MQRIAVLASGRGSNLQAILDAIDAGTLPAQVVGVFSDRPGAVALQRVDPSLRWSGDPKTFESREAYETALADAIAACGADWIVCAGYKNLYDDIAVPVQTRSCSGNSRLLEKSWRVFGLNVHDLLHKLWIRPFVGGWNRILTNAPASVTALHLGGAVLSVVSCSRCRAAGRRAVVRRSG